MRLRWCLLLLLLFVGGPALAVTGVVTDVLGAPMEKVRVCYFETKSKTEMGCTETNAKGVFSLPDTRGMLLRASAEGYYPETIPAVGQHTVVLERSPTLTVRLLDATSGEPIDSGEVFVVYSSAKMKGPFPANRHGVKIARFLKPGEVRLIGKAEGYVDGAPQAVTLERGKDTEVSLRLHKK